jgi:hypothetical protein
MVRVMVVVEVMVVVVVSSATTTVAPAAKRVKRLEARILMVGAGVCRCFKQRNKWLLFG